MKNLIEICWAQDPYERPSFQKISEELLQITEVIIESGNMVDKKIIKTFLILM